MGRAAHICPRIGRRVNGGLEVKRRAAIARLHGQMAGFESALRGHAEIGVELVCTAEQMAGAGSLGRGLAQTAVHYELGLPGAGVR